MIETLRRNTWNWLPTFIEIAETGSVSAASRKLGLTQAAVSRTLRLLEAGLGHELFNRVGRSLVLNQRGAALRDAVRGAQHGIDNGLRSVLGDPFRGPLTVASLGVLTEYLVIPSLVELKQRHPELEPRHLNITTVEANALMSRGQLDVAFYYEEVSMPELALERLGELGCGIYCGRRHPLYRERKVGAREILHHEFSVPSIGDTGRVRDGWPPEIPRKEGMRITTLGSNLQVSLSGALLTVLPDLCAAPYVARRELRRFARPALPAIEVFAARHAATSERSAITALVELVKQRVGAEKPQRRRRDHKTAR